MKTFWPSGTIEPYVARATDFPDALVAGVLAARHDQPIMLVGTKYLPTLTREMLMRSRHESMAAKLSTSERAITIAVDQISGVAGYVSSGDHVDIYATFTIPAPSKGGERRADLRTYLLLANVRVLETGVKTGLSRRRAFAGKSSAYTSVTLRVKEQDAHILAFSQMQGQLTLALRPPGDPTQPARRDLDMDSLLKLLGSRAGGGG